MVRTDREGLADRLATGFARACGVEVSSHLRRYVREGRGTLPAGACLLAWDANSVHSFVFDTTNATGIRGASDVLREIDRTLWKGTALELAEEQILYAGGGSGMAVVGEKVAPAVQERLHRLFLERSRIATCSAALVSLGSGEEGFSPRVRAVSRELARSRALNAPDAEPAVPFFVERCSVCGRRAAVSCFNRRSAPEGRYECEPCNLRIEQGRTNVRFQNEPSDFADIADREGEGFYAVVYADGNGIGRIIQSLDSPLRYAAFSRAITRLMKYTFQEVAGRHGLAGDEGEEEREEGSEAAGKGQAPAGRYQLPICGGDDLVAIVPGEVAVPLTRDLLKALERGAAESEDLRQTPLGASGGVAISHVKYPIRHLLNEAEALLAAAKRRVYDAKENGAGGTIRSALSFAVVTDGSPRSESVEPERWARPDIGEMLLSGKPYSLTELEDLSRRFNTVRSAGSALGRSQLYALQRQASAGPAQLRSHVLYQIGRREEWRGLVVRLSGRGQEVLLDPEACLDQVTPTYGGRKVFDIADMLELSSHWREPEEAPEP